MNNIYSLKLSKEELLSIEHKYQKYKIDSNNDYIYFLALYNGVEIAIYQNKNKVLSKVTFKGDKAYQIAKKYDASIIKNDNEEISASPKGYICFDEQIGSDEVGVGDFFGPICVCAAYIKKSDIKKLDELGVMDSKKMSDEDILTIGPILIKEFDYSQVYVDNAKYNELIAKGNNLNVIKARLHNQALLHSLKKHSEVKNIFMDQFVEKEKYYQYLSQDHEIVRGIVFHTKGESLYPCVALASVIARYSFLIKMGKLSSKIGYKIPFGASAKVTEFAKKIYKKIGREEFDKIVKKNFANYDEVVFDSDSLI